MKISQLTESLEKKLESYGEANTQKRVVMNESLKLKESFEGQDVEFYRDTYYYTGSPYIVMFVDGEPWADVTINLSAYDLDEDEVFLSGDLGEDTLEYLEQTLIDSYNGEVKYNMGHYKCAKLVPNWKDICKTFPSDENEEMFYESINRKRAKKSKYPISEAFADDTVCCLCGNPIEGYGNNPAPLDNTPGARCCDICNMEVVKKRMELLKNFNPSMNESVKPKPLYTKEGHIQDAVNHYRKLANLTGEEDLTEDMLRKSFIEDTCCKKSITPEELKNALLRR